MSGTNVLFAVALSVVGCTEWRAPVTREDDARVRVLEEGTPEALGVLAMLDDPGTTVAVLDVDAGLDARAAKNLVSHRDGPDARYGTADDDRFDTVAEIDAVPQVGEATLGRLVDFAEAGGWIEDPSVYGVVEGVTLSVVEAAAALGVANGESQGVLDDEVGLDARAARGIVDGRPFATIEEVAAVRYVGSAAIRNLVAWGVAHPAGDPVDTLLVAVDGLWFMSESDYPLEVWELAAPSGPVDAGNVADVLAAVYVPRDDRPGIDERTVETTSLSWMFDRFTIQEDWWEPEQIERQPQWQSVRDVFEQDLSDTRVYRLGMPNSRGDLMGDIDVFVFGWTEDGRLVGVRTVAVET